MSLKCPKCNCVLEVRLTAAPPMQADNWGGGGEDSGTGDLGELLAAAEANATKDHEIEFVRSTRERYDQYGDRTKMSEKQLAWLRRIAG